MSWVALSELKAICSVDDFYCGVNVWLQRPNVVNKRLLGAVAVIDEKRVTISTQSGENVDELERGRQVLAALARLYHEEMQGEACTSYTREEARPLKGTLRQLLPKMRSALKGWEAVLFDESNHSVVFCPLSSLELPSSIPECSYRLLFSPANGQDFALLSRIRLQVRRPLTSTMSATDIDNSTVPSLSLTNGVTIPTHHWLSSVLLPKLAQWCEESTQQLPTAGRWRRRGESLVPLGRYSQLYAELKEKYGPTLVQNWPEGTDPHKFVYEDIAIATYLLVLWEGERAKKGLTEKQSFIDLGCGNGLLVYLLTSEGHRGKGIDLRERKIWRMYSGKAHLEVGDTP